MELRGGARAVASAGRGFAPTLTQKARQERLKKTTDGCGTWEKAQGCCWLKILNTTEKQLKHEASRHKFI
jgi:hypothetical protein